MDRELAVWLPFTGVLTVLWFVWMVTLFAVGRAGKKRGWNRRDIAAVRGPVKVFGVVAVVVLLVGVLGGGLHWPGVLVATPWVAYLGAKTLVGLSRGDWKGMPGVDSDREQPAVPRSVSRRLSAATVKVLFLLNTAFLVLAILSVPASFAYARSTARMIALLDYPSSGTNSVLVFGLLRKGDAAVQPLIRASVEALQEENDPSRTWTLDPALFCLGRIGGPKAEAFLARVVTQRVRFKDYGDYHWQESACLAYAECARGRAVPDLVALYGRCTEDPAARLRWVPLVALARTASRDGISFVLDHMRTFWSRTLDGGKPTQMTVAALVLKADPGEIAALPVQGFGRLFAGPPPPLGTRAEALSLLARYGGVSISELRQQWERDKEAITAHWLTALE
jgi:hypothetical protein